MNPQSLSAIVATFEPDAVVNIARVFIVDRDEALMAKVDALGVTWAFAGVELTKRSASSSKAWLNPDDQVVPAIDAS